MPNTIFFATILALPDFRLAAVFQMATTLCDGMDTPMMVVVVKDS